MCTTNVYTYVYPDGRKETSRRPTLCSHSRYNVPCPQNVVFQHPPQYVPYPGESSSAPHNSSPYLSASHFPPTPSYTPRSTTPNYRSGDESDRSAGYRSGGSSASHSKNKHSGNPATVYVNGKKVYDASSSSRRERIVMVDGPPTPHTPPKSYGSPSTTPSSPSSPYIVNASPDGRSHSAHRRGSSTSSPRRPVIVDERPNRVEIDIVEGLGVRRNSKHVRGSSTSSYESSDHSHRSHDEEAAAAARQRKREREELRRREKQREERLRDRIAQANAEIASRPVVPMAPQPPRRSTTTREEDLVDAVRRLEIEEDRRRRREQEQEDQAQRQRLMERMMPKRRATVSSGNRRTRVSYDDGMYRWE